MDSVIYSDGWRSYNVLVDVGYGKYLRVDYGKDEFVRGRAHVNALEWFWGYVNPRLVRFRRINEGTFYWHLKECEFRFNHHGPNCHQFLLMVLGGHPLN